MTNPAYEHMLEVQSIERELLALHQRMEELDHAEKDPEDSVYPRGRSIYALIYTLLQHATEKNGVYRYVEEFTITDNRISTCTMEYAPDEQVKKPETKGLRVL